LGWKFMDFRPLICHFGILLRYCSALWFCSNLLFNIQEEGRRDRRKMCSRRALSTQNPNKLVFWSTFE
jgi:hypothetical protein